VKIHILRHALVPGCQPRDLQILPLSPATLIRPEIEFFMSATFHRFLPFLICFAGFLFLAQLQPSLLHAQTPTPPSRTSLQAWRDATFLSRTPLPIVEQSTSALLTPDWELVPGQAVVWQQGMGNDWNIRTYFHGGNNISDRILDYDPAPQLRPRIRPFTDEVVYVLVLNNSETELVKTSMRGTPRMNLTNSPGIDDYPAWSQDGNFIYFASTRDGNWEIYRMDADGANTTRLTQDSAPNLYPAISPDGTTLAWITYATNTAGAIFIQSLTSGSIQQLTPVLAYPSELLWSADGSALYFSYDGNDDFWFDIGKVNRDGTDLRRFRGAAFWNDLAPSSRYLGDDDVLLNRYTYGVANNQLILQDVTIDRLQVPESELQPWLDENTQFVVDADHHVIDNHAPTVTMNPVEGEWVRSFPSFPISWVVSDTSIFTATTYDVQQRLDMGAWTMIYTGTTETQFDVAPQTGIPVEFRVRGRDQIGNIGEWSTPTHPVRTYDFGLDVSLTDNRGIPITHAVLGSPLIVGQERVDNGTDRAYFHYPTTTTITPITFEAEGYSTFAPYNFRLDTNTPAISTFNAYVRSTNELLTNGGFESNFSGWRTWQAWINAPYVHTGERAAEMRPINSGETARLYRAVIIPEGMYQPTFAFFYRKTNYTGIPLQVLVHNGVTETIAYEGGTTSFNLGWVDMQPWAGETVTVTFSVAQGTNPQMLNNVIIDNVSLTSWATPQITTVTPAVLPYPATGTTISVTGENLIAPLTILLNDVEITATVQDSNTATFVVPTGITPGWHPLTIRNGAGIPATWSGVLKIGSSVAMPLIYRP
jgi:hypothetical protein